MVSAAAWAIFASYPGKFQVLADLERKLSRLFEMFGDEDNGVNATQNSKLPLSARPVEYQYVVAIQLHDLEHLAISLSRKQVHEPAWSTQQPGEPTGPG